MQNNGYIVLWRKVRESGLWPRPGTPYSKLEAWVDILMRAAWRDHSVLFNGQLVGLKRGELVTSERILGHAWSWDRSRVHRYLKKLEKEGALDVKKPNHQSNHQSNHRMSHLTVCKYTTYQDGRTTDRTTDRTTNAPREKEVKKRRSKTTMSSGARRVLEFLNAKSGRNYHFVDANLSLISQRLEEARRARVDDPELLAKKIIARKLGEARDPDELFSLKYLRPATLFAKSNFWNYAGEIPDHE